jgi:hypothetical protein
MNFLRVHLMSIIADREILTSSATVGALSIVFGCVSQFRPPIDPEYYLGYALIGGGALLLLATLAAWYSPRLMPLLRYLFGGLLVLLLLGILLGYNPAEKVRPQGRYVSLVETPPLAPA